MSLHSQVWEGHSNCVNHQRQIEIVISGGINTRIQKCKNKHSIRGINNINSKNTRRHSYASMTHQSYTNNARHYPRRSYANDTRRSYAHDTSHFYATDAPSYNRQPGAETILLDQNLATIPHRYIPHTTSIPHTKKIPDTIVRQHTTD